MHVVWTLPEETARAIIKGLGVHPYNEVAALIDNLTRVTEAQLQPQTELPPTDAPPAGAAQGE